MTVDKVFALAIGPDGALILLLFAVVWLWAQLRAEKAESRAQRELTRAQEEETRKVAQDRDHWRELYLVTIVSGERLGRIAETVLPQELPSG